METFYIKANDGLNISVAVKEVENPVALVQFVYGLKEWKEKYYPLMEELACYNIASIVSDNRGHGKSVSDKNPQGYFKSTSQIVHDQMKVTRFIKSLFPRKDLFVVAHSYGSMIMREYIKKHDDELKGLLMTGTVFYIPIINTLLRLAERVVKINGPMGKHLSAMLDRDRVCSWISTNENFMDSLHKNDYWLNFQYTNQALLSIGKADKALHDIRSYQTKNKKLKILSLTGGKDPFTGGILGLNDTIYTLKKIGYSNVVSEVYHDMKHDVFFEKNNLDVKRKMIDFVLNKGQLQAS